MVKIAPAAGRKRRREAGWQRKQERGAEGQAGLPKRKLGLRGAAPWAARHAAKHAAEARARAAEPPPPGSARATIRVPTGAEELKAKIGELHNALVQIRSYRKHLNKGFFDIGGRSARRPAAQAVRGQGLRLVRGVPRARNRSRQDHLAQVRSRFRRLFVKAAALEYGMDKAIASLQALEASADAPSQEGSPAPPPAQAVEPAASRFP